MSIETVRIKDLEEVSVNDIERMWIPVDSATPDSTNKVKLSAFAAYVGGISDGKYIPLAGSSSITGSLVPSVADAALGSGSHKWLSLFAGGVHASDLLAIPQAAPSDPDPLESYLYCNTSGNYAETPSGGVANIYDLTIRRGSVSAGTYNLGEQAADINLSSLFSGYATESWVSSNFNNYTLPTASSSTKGGIKVGSTLTISSEVLNVVTGSVTQSNTGFVTGGDVYSAIAAAVTSALHYRGISSTALTDGGTETATIGGVALTPQSGDVVIYGGFEFLWENNVWNKLGDDTSYALKTVTIFGDGTYITGGGDLTTARTLTLGSGVITSLGKADSSVQKIKVGSSGSELSPSSGVVTLPEYKLETPTGTSNRKITLGSNNVTIYAWALASTKPSYTLDEVTDGSTRKLANYVLKSGDTMTGDLTFDASSDAKNIYWKKSDNNTASAVKMTSDGHLYYGMQQLSYGKETNIYGKVLRLYWNTSSATRGFIFAGDTIQPTPNGVVSLGISSYRFSALYSKGANLDTFLAIPQSAPSTSASWYSANDAYLYADTSGNYSEEAGGGVANVYPLTITINGTSTVYNPGSAAQTVSFGVPTSAQISAWNAKYDKPSGGIPGTDLATAYLPLTGNAVASKITGNVILGNNVFLQGVHTNGTAARELIGLDNNNIVTVGCSTNQLRLLTSSVDIKHNKNGTLYSVYDESNLTKSVLTGLLDANNGYYLPLTGGTLTGYLKLDNSIPRVVFATGSTTYGYITMTSVGTLQLYDTSAFRTVYHTGNLSLATLAGSSAVGSSTQPVYYTGSALAACDLSTTYAPYNANGYLPLSAGSSYPLTGDLYFDASSASKSIYWKDQNNVSKRAIIFDKAGGLSIGYDNPSNSKITYVDGYYVLLRAGSTRQYEVGLDASGVFRTTTNNNVSLGSSSYKWSALYATTLYGNLALSYLQNADDLKAIEALTGTGLAKRTADNTWVLHDSSMLDTSTESSATFTRRATPSAAVGDSGVVKKIYGNTVAWNQQYKNTRADGSAYGGITFKVVDDYSFYYTGTASATNNITQYVPTISGHKYYYGCPQAVDGIYVGSSNVSAKSAIATASSTILYVGVLFASGKTYSNAVVYKPVLIDLTLMFGSGSEPSTTAEFEALYPLINYSYTTGSLTSFTAALPVKFNQMASAYDSSNWAVLTYTTKTTDAATQSIVVTSSNSTSAAKGIKLNNFSFVTGHKYYIRAEFESGAHIGFYNSSNGTIFNNNQSGVGVVGEVTSSTSYFGCRVPNATASGTSYHFSKIQCIDLTSIFGQGCEPSASEFEQLCPERYYPPCTNEDMVIQGGLRTGGFNLFPSAPWNHSANTTWPAFAPDKCARVTAGVQYSLSHSALGVTNWRHMYKAFDLNGNVITANLFTSADGSPYCNTTYGYWMEGSNNTWTSVTMTFAQDCYVYFGFGSGAVAATTPMPTDFCFNVYDANRNGTYEPHWTSLLPLPITTITSGGSAVFADGMKGAGTAYDELTSTKAVKRIEKVDLGSLSWTLSGTVFISSDLVGTIEEPAASSSMPNAICSKYGTSNYVNLADKTFTVIFATSTAHGRIYIQDSAYSDAPTFTTAMNGVYLVYELATPVEYTLDNPLPLHFKSDKLGTQEIYPNNATTPGSAPMKADFQYGSNLGDSAEANEGYLQKNGGRVSGELNVAGALAVPTQAPANPEVGKYYLWINTSGNYAQ